MKKWVAFLVSGMLLMDLMACGADKGVRYPWNIGDENTFVFEEDGKVLLTIADGTLTSSGATLVVQNQGSAEIFIGKEYSVQISVDNEWRDIEKEQDWTLEMLSVAPGEDESVMIDWSSFYGELPAGRYRLIKKYLTGEASAYIFCEFEIS